MEFSQLGKDDYNELINLIIDMYSHIDNIEYIKILPIDKLSVQNILTNSRYYVLGAWEKKQLVAVSCLDYQCGKLLDKIDFSKYCDTKNLVEVGFTMVHSNFRGRGIMKELLQNLNMKAREGNFTHTFSEVHNYNFASIYSFLHTDYKIICKFKKEFDKSEFEYISNLECLHPNTRKMAKITLSKYNNSEKVIAPYSIVLKKI